MRIHWVRILWAAGMLVWFFAFTRRARRLPKGHAHEVACCAMAGGFFLAYRYESALALLGAAVGAFAWMAARKRLRDWRSIGEDAAWAFPFAWILVRLGCTIERAHAGRLSDSWLALSFPGGSRWDLAFLEMLWAVAASGILLAFPRTPALPFAAGSLGLFRLAVWPLRMNPQPADLLFPIVLLCVAVAASGKRKAGNP